MSFWFGRIAKISMPAMIDTRNFGLLWAIQVFLKGLDKFWSILATLGHFQDLGHIGPFWVTFGVWAIFGHLGYSGPLCRSGTLGHFGLLGPLLAILGHFWGLAHFRTFWATFGVPTLGFRFGYDQVDCVAPVFKKKNSPEYQHTHYHH